MLLAELVPQAETGSGDGPHIHQLHVELACSKYSQDIASLFPLMEKRCLFPLSATQFQPSSITIILRRFSVFDCLL